MGAAYITRLNNKHAKAGNINHALEKTDGDIIVIFDTDHTPKPEFLRAFARPFPKSTCWIRAGYADFLKQEGKLH